MGRRRGGRPVNGILLLDKPVGDTSNAALQRVKRLFQARKAGHTGSLDPLASGMLPLCLGEATKVSAFLLDADKAYQVRCRLGQRTDTADADGRITEERPVPELDPEVVEAALARFRGAIEQVPPMYSAVKHQGERLYKLAREGVEVERKPRQVSIHELEAAGLEGEELLLTVRCSKGTYVRTLVEDIAGALGTVGHVVALRRTQVGPFREAGMVDMETLETRAGEGLEALDALLLDLDTAIADWPAVRLDPDSAYYIRQGQPVLVPRAPTEGWVRLYREQDFLGMGEIIADGRVAPRRLVSQA